MIFNALDPLERWPLQVGRQVSATPVITDAAESRELMNTWDVVINFCLQAHPRGNAVVPAHITGLFKTIRQVVYK